MQQLRLKRKADKEAAQKLEQELRDEFRQRELLSEKEFGHISREEKQKVLKAKAQEKHRRRRLLRFYLKSQVRNFFLSFRSVNAANIKKKIRDFRENAPKRRLFIIIAFNSTVLFLLSYLFLFFLSQFITVISAGFFDYPTTIYYYDIYFNIKPGDWYHDSVKTIYSSGPLVNFVIGIVFLILYTNLRETTGTLKLFFLWGFLHAVNMLFGAMLIGTLFETGVGHVISWMYIMDTGRVLYSTVSIFLLIISGIIATKQFLFSGNSYYNKIDEFNRSSFVIPQVLVPYLAGNIFMILLRQPRFVFYDSFTLLTLCIPVMAVLASYRTFNELYFEEEEKNARPALIVALVLTGFILFFRIILAIGIRFGG